MLKNRLLMLAGTMLIAMFSITACTAPVSQAADNNQNDLRNQAVSPLLKDYGSLWKSELYNDDRFMLDHQLTAREARLARSYAGTFKQYMRKGSLFMHHLLTELHKRNMPVELAALPLVESGFNMRARGGSAHGPWQFLRSTGRSLGLTRTSDYDEFYDFIESTNASLSYLQRMYRSFGNWDLAVAAYNQGAYGVQKAVDAARNRGVTNPSPDNVRLAAGARNYLMRFHAYADLLHYPDKYGVSMPRIQNRPAFKRVMVAGKVNSMQEAAALSGVRISVLKHLNAGYTTDSLRRSQERGLLVPIDQARKFEEAIGAEPKDPAALNAMHYRSGNN